CANAPAYQLCVECASPDTLCISPAIPHSPNPPYLVNRPLLSTALAPAIQREDVLLTII
ncbi:hypothetical protein FB107DRAFT_183655, partial [Schizophyllum commune]